MSRIEALYDAFLRKTPQQSRSRSVVEAILGAAAEKVARSSDEEEVTLQDVASRAGVGVGSLYDYFRDRRSLLAALAAKITEDNLRAFEEVLATTATLSLEDTVARLVDFCFETYATNKRVPRAVLRIAHQVGLMPALAQSQTVFAESLASALRKRTDIDHPNLDLAAWTLTQATMGIIGTLVWQDTPPHTTEQLRGELVRLFTKHLKVDQKA